MPTEQPHLSINRPIQKQKLADQVFDRLWQLIEDRELAPGDTLPSERVLMEQFGVGRPAVREALHMLANKGVISISHGERSRVKELTASTAVSQIEDIAKLMLSSQPANLEHLKQLRVILEVGTVRIAAEKCTDADVETLNDLVQAQRAVLGQDKPFVKADIAFHVGLARVTGNPLLETVTQAMLSWLFAYYKPLLHWEGREQTTLKEHATLVALLAKRDADGAVRLIEDHLGRSDPLYTVKTERS
ncbi:transcriptional regulator NanR [Rhodobacteraceae bacterium 2CG4]|uniref:Transcriptional regulator NanR n=1 Tax=Halovulum marinum TaxID=2662447 RepID=A0A6L5Z1A5_9RHOB|nr:transcriptional regulator NanR [Halovulum marinum]MSU90327.1 transcriptional regulator NanR [Halovulum marinum]